MGATARSAPRRSHGQRIIAPVGWLIDHGGGGVYIAQLVVGCGAVVVAAYLEPRLPTGVKGVPEAALDEEPVSA